MYQFVCSADGKYSAALKGQKLTCARDGRPFWQEELPYADNNLLSIGNNANIITLSDESITLIIPEKASKHTTIKGLSKRELAENNSILTGIYMNESGSQLCVGRKTSKSGLKTKIKNFFSFDNKHEFDTEDHVISFVSLTVEKEKEYFTESYPLGIPNKFLWSISPDFKWLALSEPNKNLLGVHNIISLINVNEYLSYTSMKISNGVPTGLTVNNDGTVVLETDQHGFKAANLLYKTGQSLEFIFDSGWNIRYLGNNYIVYDAGKNRLVAKNFMDQIICDVSLEPLDNMNVPYHIHFMDKNNISILEAVNDELKVVRTSIDMISIDAKRWQFIQNSMKEQKLAQEQKKSEQNAKALLFEKKKQELASTISMVRPIRPQNEDEPYDFNMTLNSEPAEIEETPEEVIPPVSLEDRKGIVPEIEEIEEPLDLEDRDIMRRKKISLSSDSQTHTYLPKDIVDQLIFNDDLAIPTEHSDTLSLINATEKAPVGPKKEKPTLLTLEPKKERELPNSLEEAKKLAEQAKAKFQAAQKLAHEDNTEKEQAPETGKLPKIDIQKIKLAKDESSEGNKEADLKISGAVISPPSLRLKKLKHDSIVKSKEKKEQAEVQTAPVPEEIEKNAKNSEKLKLLKLIEQLEERFILGEISESVYKELKVKYWRKMKDFN